jgi:hypothetical protein
MRMENKEEDGWMIDDDDWLINWLLSLSSAKKSSKQPVHDRSVWCLYSAVRHVYVPSDLIFRALCFSEAKKSGAKMQAVYHPGIWVKAFSKYNCCGDGKESAGCEPVTIDIAGEW